jgi:hypothetical protein
VRRAAVDPRIIVEAIWFLVALRNELDDDPLGYVGHGNGNGSNDSSPGPGAVSFGNRGSKKCASLLFALFVSLSYAA